MKVLRRSRHCSSHTMASSIEMLESRIAPAVVVNPANHQMATYTDVDGDKVTIKVDHGNLMNAAFTSVAAGTLGGEQLQLIDLSDSGFNGVKLTVSATPQNGHGDGLTAVGYVNAGGRDLTAVTIDGDLGRLDVGNSNFGTPGLKQLTANSLGQYGTSTQETGGMLRISALGGVTAFTVKTGITNESIELVGASPTQTVLGKMKVGGSVTGGPDNGSGSILLLGGAGSVFLGGDLVGGDGDNSGKIFVNGHVGSLTIRGSVIGGNGNEDQIGQEGQIHAYSGFGKIAVGGDLRGGPGSQTASIISGLLSGTAYDSSASIGSLSVGGSVVVDGSSSGNILVLGDVGKLAIGHDVTSSLSGASVTIATIGRMGSFTVGGSIRAYSLATNVIQATTFGSIVVKGSLEGAADGAVVVILAPGNDVSAPAISDGLAKKLSLAIKSVKIGGSVVNASIAAGLSYLAPNTINPDVVIGSVKVAGDWLGGTLAAGIGSGADFQYGTADDTVGGLVPSTGRAAVTATIKGFTVGGRIEGTSSSTADHFGIVAQLINSVVVNGVKVPLLPGASNDTGTHALEIGIVGDFTIREV